MNPPPHTNLLQSNSVSCCQECGISQSDCWILHNFQLKAVFRRLCTNCVLKNNLASFCPVCFELYNDSTAPPCHERVMCFKCPSISHLSCISPRFSSTFLCPLCSDPKFAFFNGLGQSESAGTVSAGRTIDRKSTKVLLAAATFAAQSMRKAVADARAVAAMKIESAAIAKKEATLALERLAFLVQQEKVRKESANSNTNEDADSNAITDSNGDADSDDNSDNNGDTDSKTNSDSNGDADSDDNSDSNGDADSKANSDSNGDNADSKANSDTNGDANSKANSDTNGDADSKTNSNSNGDADSNADSNSKGDADFAELTVEELTKMLESDSDDDN